MTKDEIEIWLTLPGEPVKLYKDEDEWWRVFVLKQKKMEIIEYGPFPNLETIEKVFREEKR